MDDRGGYGMTDNYRNGGMQGNNMGAGNMRNEPAYGMYDIVFCWLCSRG